jgi:hypothetical protein
MKQAIGIARKSKGQYTKAYNEIEKIKKGLGDEHIIANALKKANESFSEGHDCENEHPGVSHESWKSKKNLGASYESKKYYDTKSGSIQDAVMQMQVNEQKSVTVRVKELSALIETYLAKGGVSHNLSPVIAEKELSGVLPLQAVREFIGTYNRHFLTNYRAEEFIVRDELDEAQKWDLKDIQNMIKNSPKVKPYPNYHFQKLHPWDDYDLHRVKSRYKNSHSILKWDLKKISPNTDKGVDQLKDIENAVFGLSQGLKKGKLSKKEMIALSKEGVPLLSDIAKSLV